MTIIYFLLLLTVIICIHELGHLLTAKLFGVYCYEYSFGMGPALFQKKGKETIYSIRAIPIGGFVSMAGEPDGDAAYPDVVVPDHRRLTNIAPWKRIIVLLAGVTMNFLLAFFLFSMVVLAQGAYVESPKPIIQVVMPDSPAEKAGLQAGDIITQVMLEDGTSLQPETFTDIQLFFSANEGEPETYVVLRDGKEITYTITPNYIEEEARYIIGIQAQAGTYVETNLFNCWKYGLQEMWTITKLMFTTIMRLFRGRGLNQLSGPVGIYNATETVVSYGLISYLFLVAQLSLNVGIFNLLPLPVLDGGQVVFTLGEWITGRPLNQNVKLALMSLTWVLLIGMMLFVTWNDISRLFG
ncbi:MAG: RIP metalloprotease RseP [Solobacterium sp.]|nr:RIP metalloprotease RseP [Solobacterium sp.]